MRDLPVAIIREFDPSRDNGTLRECFIELQNVERRFDPGKPEGSAVVDAYLDRMLARCRQWDGRVFVAELADQLIGFICVWARVLPDEPDDSPAEYAFVSDLIVRSTHRRQGIGSQLLSAAEGYARARKARCLRIGVSAGNVAAKSLYESAGFQEYEVELAKQLT
jgi:ribosomal protein S18 acetylase RimI-like enzyme